MKKMGISPVIATILLIAIVVILALIIFLWATRVIEEGVEKNGLPSYQVCSEIKLKAEYNEAQEKLQVINTGTIPVYEFQVKKTIGGREVIQPKSEDGSSAENVGRGLALGQSTIISITGNPDKIEIIPVILGETETSKKIDVCEDNILIAE